MEFINIQHFSDIDELVERDEIFDECEINPDLGEDRIILSSVMYRLRNTNYLIAEGTYCTRDEDTGELLPDFSVSLLYDSSHGLDLDNPLYWEQDPPATMFHNYVVMQTSYSVSTGENSVVLLEACVA